MTARRVEDLEAETQGNGQQSPSGRRVYRNRGLMWISVLTATLAAAVILVPMASGSDEDGDALGVGVVVTLMAAVMLWIGFRPRTVVQPEILVLYSFFSRRSVAWTDIQQVTVSRDPKTGTDGIALIVKGADVRVSVPGIGSFGLGRQYMTRAAADIKATWQAEAHGKHSSEQIE